MVAIIGPGLFNTMFAIAIVALPGYVRLSRASALGELTVTVSDGHVTRVEGAVHELYADQYQPDARLAARAGVFRPLAEAGSVA